MGRAARSAFIRTLLLTTLALTGAATADAASRVSVGLSQSVRLAVGGGVSNVVVSNPAIADVTVVDAHSVIVQGKGFGSTQVMVLDNAGHLLLDSIITVVAPQDGQLTLYRGITPHEFSCSPRCEPDSARPTGAGQPSATPGQ